MNFQLGVVKKYFPQPSRKYGFIESKLETEDVFFHLKQGAQLRVKNWISFQLVCEGGELREPEPGDEVRFSLKRRKLQRDGQYARAIIWMYRQDWERAVSTILTRPFFRLLEKQTGNVLWEGGYPEQLFAAIAAGFDPSSCIYQQLLSDGWHTEEIRETQEA